MGSGRGKKMARWAREGGGGSSTERSRARRRRTQAASCCGFIQSRLARNLVAPACMADVTLVAAHRGRVGENLLLMLRRRGKYTR